MVNAIADQNPPGNPPGSLPDNRPGSLPGNWPANLPPGLPHDVPSAAQLLESVREWIERDVLTQTGGRLQFHARVAINCLAMVEREMSLGPDQDRAHRDRLATIGVADDAELAAAIRCGDLDDRLAEVRELVWASVRDKLSVANPRYLGSSNG